MLDTLKQFKWFVETKQKRFSDNLVTKEMLKYASCENPNRESEKDEVTHHDKAVCLTEKVCLAVLSRQHFLKIAKQVEIEQKKEKIKQIRSTVQFKNVSSFWLRKFIDNINEVYYNKGQYVFHQGSSTKFVYIVLEG